MCTIARAFIIAMMALCSSMALCSTAAPARADEAADAFSRGMKHLGASRYDAACQAFEQAEEHGGATMKTRYQLGRCNQERGRHVVAHRAFADVERLATAAGDEKRAAAAARTRMKEVAKHVGLLTLGVPESTATLPRLRITRDGEPVAPHDFGRPVAVSPGAHEVTVAAEGREALRLPVSAIAPGQSAQLDLPALGAETASAGAPPPDRAQRARPGDDGGSAEDHEGPGKASPTLFWTGLGFVIAGPLLAAGGVYTYVEEEETEAGIAGMVVGGALLAVGIPFMIYGGTGAEPEQAAVVVGPGSLGMSGRF